MKPNVAVVPTMGAVERHFILKEVATACGVSETTVRRMFEDQPGVLKITMPRLLAARKHSRAPSYLFRRRFFERLYQQRTAGFSVREIKRTRSTTCAPS